VGVEVLVEKWAKDPVVRHEKQYDIDKHPTEW
jgi:hypothetical protein